MIFGIFLTIELTYQKRYSSKINSKDQMTDLCQSIFVSPSVDYAVSQYVIECVSFFIADSAFTYRFWPVAVKGFAYFMMESV